MSVENLNQQEQVRTREEYRRAKAEEQRPVNEEKVRAVDKSKKVSHEKVTSFPLKRVRIRMMPIWLRVFLLVIFTAASLAGGAVVGYSILGGGKTDDVFKKSTWTHVKDLVEKGTPDHLGS